MFVAQGKASVVERRQLWPVITTLGYSIACCLPAEICIWPWRVDHSCRELARSACTGSSLSQAQRGDLKLCRGMVSSAPEELLIGHQEEFIPVEGGQALERAAQGRSGVPIAGGV